MSSITIPENGQILACGKRWRTDALFKPSVRYADGSEIFFCDAGEITSSRLSTGLGDCLRTVYGGFAGDGALRFETDILALSAEDRLDCTFVILEESGRTVEEIRWPAPLTADGEGCYAVLNTMQGQLLPSDWPKAVGENIPFDGQMCSSAAYMPWWGEVTPEGAYLAVVRAPWDTKYTVEHPAGGPTRIFARHLPSLGKMAYQRTVSFYFLPAGSTYADLCRRYRAIADEEGRAVTLREKAAGNPNVDRLIGACVMTTPGKYHTEPESRYYDAEYPENNDSLFPFSIWEDRVRMLHDRGVDQLYLHQDG